MSDCVSSSEKSSTLAWLGGWSLTTTTGGPGGQAREGRRPASDADKRRASCKGVESAMAGSMGKVWYDSWARVWEEETQMPTLSVHILRSGLQYTVNTFDVLFSGTGSI